MALNSKECPHLTKMIEALSHIKVQIRNLEATNAGDPRAALIASISDLETHVHDCATEIETFKQELLDDYATTLFQTHAQPQSVNPFIVTKSAKRS